MDPIVLVALAMAIRVTPEMTPAQKKRVIIAFRCTSVRSAGMGVADAQTEAIAERC
ncbi:hypothetical protein MJ575_10365 [Klebsiella pneumoniae]|nr:hypothetical protein MJ575_10365 [Klebsiella pneumoniae]